MWTPITPALMPAAIRMFAMQVRYRAADGGPAFVRFLWLLTPIHAFGVLWLAAWVLATMRLTVAIVVAIWSALSILCALIFLLHH